MPPSRSDTYLRTITTGMDFALRKKISFAMLKSKKSTRCCPARARVVASSHTSVNIVEPKKRSISDATVASARIVARITQTSGRNLSETHYSMCHTDMRCSRFLLLCGSLWGEIVFYKRFWWTRQLQLSTTQFPTSTETEDWLPALSLCCIPFPSLWASIHISIYSWPKGNSTNAAGSFTKKSALSRLCEKHGNIRYLPSSKRHFQRIGYSQCS